MTGLPLAGYTRSRARGSASAAAAGPIDEWLNDTAASDELNSDASGPADPRFASRSARDDKSQILRVDEDLESARQRWNVLRPGAFQPSEDWCYPFRVRFVSRLLESVRGVFLWRSRTGRAAPTTSVSAPCQASNRTLGGFADQLLNTFINCTRAERPGLRFTSWHQVVRARRNRIQRIVCDPVESEACGAGCRRGADSLRVEWQAIESAARSYCTLVRHARRDGTRVYAQPG